MTTVNCTVGTIYREVVSLHDYFKLYYWYYIGNWFHCMTTVNCTVGII